MKNSKHRRARHRHESGSPASVADDAGTEARKTETSVKPRSPSEMPIGELLGRMRPRDVATLVTTLVAVVSISFVAGMKSHTVEVAEVEGVNLVQLAGKDGDVQQRIRESQPVQCIALYLSAVAEGRFQDAWPMLSESEQRDFGTVEHLARHYRMTKVHRLRYFIPVRLKRDSEEYLVDFEYEDYLPRLPELFGLAKQPLGKVLDSERLSTLTDELHDEISRQFVVPEGSKKRLREDLANYLRDQVLLRDLVHQDAILDEYGIEHRWVPIPATDRTAGGEKAAVRRRLARVVLVRERGQWKMNGISSELVEKR